MIDKVVKPFCRFFSDYKYTFLCLGYFVFIALQSINFNISIPVILSSLLLLLVLNLISKVKYNWALSILFSVIISFDAYIAYAYSSIATTGIIASIFETNTAEAFSMLKEAWLPSVIIFLITTFLIFASVRELRGTNKISIKISLIGVFCHMLVMLPILCYKQVASDPTGFSSLKEYPYQILGRFYTMYSPLFYGNIATYITHSHEMSLFRKFKEEGYKEHPSAVTNDSLNTNLPNKVYVVIGESSSRSNYSLYGYCASATTPFLDSLYNKCPGVVNYYDGITSSCSTRDALRLSLSFAVPTNMDLFFKQKTIVDLAKEKGYEAVWISSQGNATFDDTYIGYLSSAADRIHMPEYFLAGMDMELIPVLSSMKDKEKKQIFFLHINGSHKDYTSRYDTEDILAIPGDDSSADIQYDRTIHHTDRVFNALYNQMKDDTSSILYYFSDHGEIIGVGHGIVKGAQQYQIPIMTINNSNINVDSIIGKYIDPSSSLINNLSSVCIIAEFLGYNITNEYRSVVKDEGRLIYQLDRSVTQYVDELN